MIVAEIKTTGNIALEFNGIDDYLSGNSFKFSTVEKEEKNIYININKYNGTQKRSN